MMEVTRQIFFRTISIYVAAYLVLLATILGLMYAYPKPELHMLVNSQHMSSLDTFFKYLSVMAEWPLYVLALLPLLWKKYKFPLFFAVCELTGGTTLQILKHIISYDRPVSVFENYPHLELPLVPGVDMYHGNSFPSGHASTFFMFCTCCVILMAIHYIREGKLRDLRTKILFNATLLLLLVFAALGAYSRVYLSQHFVSDICVGSIIGFTTPFLMLYLFRDRMRRTKTKSE